MDMIPYYRLLLAIERQALLDAIGPGTSNYPYVSQSHRQEARRWFRCNSLTPFSFLTICHILDQDPTRIRSILDTILVSKVRLHTLWKDIPNYNEVERLFNDGELTKYYG